MPRTFLALACLLLSGVAAAQTQPATGNVVVPSPPPREGTVGPEQLRNFSLPGTRTTPPASPQDPPAQPPRAAPSQPVTVVRPPAADSRTSVAPRPERAAPVQAPAPQQATPAPVQDSPVTQTSPAPITQPEALPPAVLPAPAVPLPGRPAWFGWWPWLVVAALAGVALAFFWRQRRRRIGDEEPRFEEPAYAAPEPAPAPVPPVQPEPSAAAAAPPTPDLPRGLVTTRLRAPAPPPPTSPQPARPAGGVVSTRLRPWIDLELMMREIVLTEAEALLRFDLEIANNGSNAARSIVIEALALNAGEQQGMELRDFFGREAVSGGGIAELPAMGTMVLSHEARMPRAAVRAYELQGRALFVPIIAFNASYRAGTAEGRTSAAFLVGREVLGSERLGPLRLEPGAGRLLGLGVRRLEDNVRR